MKNKHIKEMKCPECGTKVKRDKLYKMTYYCKECGEYYSTTIVEDYNLVRKGEC